MSFVLVLTSIIHLPVNISPDSFPQCLIKHWHTHFLIVALLFQSTSFCLSFVCLIHSHPWGLVLMIHSQVILLITPSPLPFSKVDPLLDNSFSCISFPGYNELLERACKCFAKFILPNSFCHVHFRGSSHTSNALRKSEGKRLFRVALRCSGIRNALKVKTAFFFGRKFLILLPFDYSLEHHSCTNSCIQEFHT